MRVVASDDDAGDARPHERVGARGLLAHVRARGEGDVGRRPGRVDAVVQAVVEGSALGVFVAVAGVPTLSDDDPVFHQHTADQGVGRDVACPAQGKLQSLAHVARVAESPLVHRLLRPPSWRKACLSWARAENAFSGAGLPLSRATLPCATPAAYAMALCHITRGRCGLWRKKPNFTAARPSGSPRSFVCACLIRPPCHFPARPAHTAFGRPLPLHARIFTASAHFPAPASRIVLRQIRSMRISRFSPSPTQADAKGRRYGACRT